MTLEKVSTSDKKTIGITMALIIGLLTIHGTVLTPAILHQVAGQTREAIMDHAATTHEGSLRSKDLDVLREFLVRRLDRLEARIDALLKR